MSKKGYTLYGLGGLIYGLFILLAAHRSWDIDFASPVLLPVWGILLIVWALGFWKGKMKDRIIFIMTTLPFAQFLIIPAIQTIRMNM